MSASLTGVTELVRNRDKAGDVIDGEAPFLARVERYQWLTSSSGLSPSYCFGPTTGPSPTTK